MIPVQDTRDLLDETANLQRDGLVTFNPERFGGRSVERFVNPDQGRFKVIRGAFLMITHHIAIKAAWLDPVDPILRGPVPFLITDDEGTVLIEAKAVRGAEAVRHDFSM